MGYANFDIDLDDLQTFHIDILSKTITAPSLFATLFRQSVHFLYIHLKDCWEAKFIVDIVMDCLMDRLIGH